MFRRNLTPRLLRALSAAPAVFLHGARQSGKTTLARETVSEKWPARYLSFDNRATLAAASTDPEAFLAAFTEPVILDEVQRVPEIFLALKAQIDRDRRPGRFLLTGSAHALMVPHVADARVGRVEMLLLQPLSQGGMAGFEEDLVAALFEGELPSPTSLAEDATHLRQRVLTGGFPEAVERKASGLEDAWYESYTVRVLQREVRNLLQIDPLATFSRLLSFLGTRSASLLNVAEISRSCDIPQTSLKRYLDLLETTFLIERVLPWSANLSKRFVKAPKLYFVDSGVLCHLVGCDEARLRQDPNLFGVVLESFVVMELKKQLTWSRKPCRLYHFRSHEGQEVDAVLEDAAGRVVGVEVKANSAVTSSDFKSLRWLADQLGERFVRGVVLYAGGEALAFGPKLWALPIPTLWRVGGAR